MTFFCRKLCSPKGEALLETLLSILIITLACTVFATMTMAATRMNAAAKTADATFYAELSAAETHDGSLSDTGTVTVTVERSDGSPDVVATFDVTYTGSTGELMRYARTGGGG